MKETEVEVTDPAIGKTVQFAWERRGGGGMGEERNR